MHNINPYVQLAFYPTNTYYQLYDLVVKQYFFHTRLVVCPQNTRLNDQVVTSSRVLDLT